MAPVGGVTTHASPSTRREQRGRSLRPLSSLLGPQGLGLVAKVTSQGTLRMGGAEARQRLGRAGDVSALPERTRDF